MNRTCRLLLALAVLAVLVPGSVPHARAASSIRLRIGVVTDGITRLTPADLQAAGVDPATVDPRTFALSSLGHPVAIRVPGGADGRFDAGDSVLFFGEKFRGPEMDQKYTDERVYWLDMGGTAGLQINTVDATPQNNLTPAADFPTTVHAEQSMVWWSLHTLNLDTQDTWFWSRLQPGSNPGDSTSRDLQYTVPDPAPGYTAQLRLEEISRDNSAYSNPDHRTTIAVNGTAVGDYLWSGKTRKVFSATVPANVLVSGMNTVKVTAINPATTTADDIYANYWEVDYRRLFRAWQGQVDFTGEVAGLKEYLVRGWTTSSVSVWDVSDAAQPRLLTGATVQPDGSEYQVRFRMDDAQGTRYWLQADDTIAGPASVRQRPPTGLRSPAGGADAVIVTHASLRAAAEALATWHGNHGRRALVVDAQDVYDEFNEGIYHPKAIAALMSWASTHWTAPAPACLTLVGDGHWNFKSFNTAVYPAPPIMIPPYLAWVDPWQGEVPADSYFGDITGDGVPEMSVGRLAANTLDEAWTVVNKIVAYGEGMRTQAWEQKALFVADNADAAGDFPALSDQIISTYLPADLTPQRIYLGSASYPDAASAKAGIRNAINAGTWMVQYAGHGSAAYWAHEYIWQISDVPGLVNEGMFPLVMTFNCLDGYFAHPSPSTYSIAETMQRRAGGGSIAALSPSGLGVTFDQHQLRQLLMEAIFWDGVREVGPALTVAKQRYLDRYGANYLLYTQMLFGDPAMRLPWANIAVPKRPVVSIHASSPALTLSWPAVTQDIFDQDTTVTSYIIWRGIRPCFDPNQPNCDCTRVATTSNLSWTDDGSIGDITPVGDPAANYFYVIQAANGAGHSAPSSHVGEFDFAMQRGP